MNSLAAEMLREPGAAHDCRSHSAAPGENHVDGDRFSVVPNGG